MNLFNYQPLNCTFPVLPPNVPVAIPPTYAWNQPCAEPFRQPMMCADDTLAETEYQFDAVTNRWLLVKYRGNRLKMRTPIIPGVTVIDERFFYANGEEKPTEVVVDYAECCRKHTVTIPIDDYNAGKVWIYFPELVPFPGCTKAQAAALLVFLLKTYAYPKKIWFFLHHGFNVALDGKLMFSAAPQDDPLAKKLAPRSIRMRRLYPISRTPSEIFTDWIAIHAGHPVLKTLGLLKIGALFLAFAPKEIQESQMLWVIQPSSSVSEQLLNSLLNANDYANYPPPCLESRQDVLLDYVSDIWDGVAVVVDRTFADEESKRIDGMKLLTKTARRDLSDIEVGRNIITLLSKSGAYTAKRLDTDRVLSLSTEGVQLQADSDNITRVESEMEALLVSAVLQSTMFQEEAPKLIANLYAECLHFHSAEYAATTTILTFALLLLQKACGLELAGDGYDVFLDELEKQTSDVISTDRAIQQDFASVLSARFRSGDFTAVRRCNSLRIDIDKPPAIVSGNRLYLSDEMMKSVLTEMTTTHNKKSLISSLTAEGVLDKKDGDTHPLDAHTLSGRYIRLYWYDISTDILDADILDYLANLEQNAFWLTRNESPSAGFLSFLCNTTGLISGRKIDYVSDENSSCYITGQSGFGKSFLLCQLMAKNTALGHKVIAFDMSDSFTHEALCRNLPPSFVNQNIAFHEIETDGIPIDLFTFSRQAKLPTQKQELLGILRAGTGELTAPQTNTLRTALSKLLPEMNPDEPFDSTRLLSLLSEGEMKCDSLCNRLKPLLDDITGYGMRASGWHDFLENSKPILVISLNSYTSKNTNQIIEMLLHTLYNFQREHTQIPLDIFIDEIQNQNFGQDSLLRKIMKEGRKTHLSFYGATQDYSPRSTELGSVMGKAATQIFLRPTQNSEPLVAQELRFGKNDLVRFDMMERGDAIIKGQLYSKEAVRNLPTILSGRVQPFDENAGGLL